MKQLSQYLHIIQLVLLYKAPRKKTEEKNAKSNTIDFLFHVLQCTRICSRYSGVLDGIAAVSSHLARHAQAHDAHLRYSCIATIIGSSRS